LPRTSAALPNEGFDDIVYFGADKGVIEALNDKLANAGIMNIVLGGRHVSASRFRSAWVASITA
jgi:hypothetical protein